MPALLLKALSILKPLILKLILDYVMEVFWDAMIKFLADKAAQTDNNIDNDSVTYLASRKDEFAAWLKSLL